MGSPYVWTAEKAIKAVRDTVGDPEAQSTRWSNVEIADYLNRGGQQLALDAEISLETQWDLVLTSGTSTYTMPVNFVSDRRVEYIKSASDVRTLESLSTQDYQEYLSRDPSITGEPSSYYFWRKLGSDLASYQPTTIVFQPTPNATANGKTVRVWGYKIPDAIDADNLTLVLEVPAVYVEATVLYAASLVKFDDGEPNTGAQFRNLYEAQVVKIRNANGRKTHSRPARIRPRSSNLSPYYMTPGPPGARKTW